MTLRLFTALLHPALAQHLCRLFAARPQGDDHDPPAPGSAALAEPAEPIRGCGWFDSSHDLQRGLSVQEHASPDAVAQDLPLAGWLALQLARPAA